MAMVCCSTFGYFNTLDTANCWCGKIKYFWLRLRITSFFSEYLYFRPPRLDTMYEHKDSNLCFYLTNLQRQPDCLQDNLVTLACYNLQDTNE